MTKGGGSGLMSLDIRSTWKRCPHLLRLSPLSKAAPESRDQPKRAESIEYGRASSTWARLIAKIYGVDPQGGSRLHSKRREPPHLSSLWKQHAGSRYHHRPLSGR